MSPGDERADWYASPDRPKPVRDRFAKLNRLRELGIEPYAYGFRRTGSLAEAFESFDETRDAEGPAVRVAGRILSMRDMGGSAFAHLGDRTGRLQVYVRKEDLGDSTREVLSLLDLGDWVGVEGPLFRTRTGEITVRVASLTLLAKTLRPLPLGKEERDEEGRRRVHGGFSNVESRYRERYADLAVNPEVRDVFRTRARIISRLREVLDAGGFLEVETPVLQPLYGGAYARPFTTYHNRLDRQLYLRIADELYLKRLIVGGLERVYEIGKNFRNEGIDRTHNPEFTMLEAYEAFADYEGMIDLAEQLVTTAAQVVTGSTRIAWDGGTLDLSAPWRRITFFDAIREYGGFEARTAEDGELRERLARHDRDPEHVAGLSRAKLLDAVFGDIVEPELRDPVVVRDFPIEMSPLAKPLRGDAELAERFEVIVAGMEIVNAFSELNDPLDQWGRLSAQARLRAEGDEEAQALDEDYVRALEYGLPPTGGLGLGVDRLVMLLTDRRSIREVILYPILREDEGRPARP